ncbi:hypothetical protein PF005_g15386 [Phytophthora fragariae]|uniref:Uncharacterized protein n=1 Tax=Phytophthora fragariae TaxID=53985 RepID=A0A6A3RS93_9STRA|nr:hypothetical protein PF003_g36991 [Phytophthora fragariae]KAE8933985.1 hypothetical protein PF009_g16032 [Phytophthora fragariae]KAE8999923.1 hypothetical protein PF011_g14421 [Phytophthora fragariae]KAE9099835.1 hypothetical protein PF010_g15041 [Phytophthora fragariae]KAE9101619.1 hypothetical protein PF007_g15077 [Phytophthora fragariae]
MQVLLVHAAVTCALVGVAIAMRLYKMLQALAFPVPIAWDKVQQQQNTEAGLESSWMRGRRLRPEWRNQYEQSDAAVAVECDSRLLLWQLKTRTSYS